MVRSNSIFCYNSRLMPRGWFDSAWVDSQFPSRRCQWNCFLNRPFHRALTGTPSSTLALLWMISAPWFLTLLVLHKRRHNVSSYAIKWSSKSHLIVYLIFWAVRSTKCSILMLSWEIQSLVKTGEFESFPFRSISASDPGIKSISALFPSDDPNEENCYNFPPSFRWCWLAILKFLSWFARLWQMIHRFCRTFCPVSLSCESDNPICHQWITDFSLHLPDRKLFHIFANERVFRVSSNYMRTFCKWSIRFSTNDRWFASSFDGMSEKQIGFWEIERNELSNRVTRNNSAILK
jgi:hypothetical protein